MGERSRHANEVSVIGRTRGDEGWCAGEDAHTTWLVLLIKDGRGPAGNYPLISTPLLQCLLYVALVGLAPPPDAVCPIL